MIISTESYEVWNYFEKHPERVLGFPIFFVVVQHDFVRLWLSKEVNCLL